MRAFCSSGGSCDTLPADDGGVAMLGEVNLSEAWVSGFDFSVESEEAETTAVLLATSVSSM